MTNILKSRLNKEQTTAWLRGLMTIAYADGKLDATEKDLFDHFSHDEFASEIEISELQTISPDELAKIFRYDSSIAENFMRTAVMVALADGVYSSIEDEVLHKYCEALGLKVKALEALKINVESKQNDALTGAINGKLADGKSLSVNLKRISESTTEVGVRIGTFGDRQRSEVIHDKILSSL